MTYSKRTQELFDRCLCLTKVCYGWTRTPIQSFHSEAEAFKYARASAHLGFRLLPALREPRNLPEPRSENGSHGIPDGYYRWRESSLSTRK